MDMVTPVLKLVQMLLKRLKCLQSLTTIHEILQVSSASIY